MGKALKGVIARLPAIMFGFGLVFFSVLYGMAAREFEWFPYQQLKDVGKQLQQLFAGNRAFFWYYQTTEKQQSVVRFESDGSAASVAPGLTKLVMVEGDGGLAVLVVDAAGAEVQSWRFDWWDVFPDAPSYLTSDEIPKSRPGTHLHGAEILPNGDLVFNFEHLAMVRMNPCGEVVWTLNYRTHHSLFIDHEGNIWASGQRNHSTQLPNYPFIKPPFIEPTVVKISPQGEMLLEKSVFELLTDNNLPGALYLTTAENFWPYVTGDSLHLNDVEVFQPSMTAGYFQPGDVMISLRNMNAVLIFDANWQLKYQYANEVVRQHDPDFIDGYRFSVFDNHNVGNPKHHQVASRLLIHDTRDQSTDVAFSGVEPAFFTHILGKHQWLDNGNLLLTEGKSGRALEVSPAGAPVWEYNNIIEPGWTAIMEEAERLPLNLDKEFFKQSHKRCSN